MHNLFFVALKDGMWVIRSGDEDLGGSHTRADNGERFRDASFGRGRGSHVSNRMGGRTSIQSLDLCCSRGPVPSEVDPVFGTNGLIG